MGVNYNPKIVTDGLVLYLDAANPKSYPGSGTTWTDLSGGNKNATLVNGPTFNSSGKGNIVFDGVNDYAEAPIPSTSITNITMTGFVNVILSRKGPFFRNGNGAGNGYAIGIGNTTFDVNGNNLVMLFPGRRWIASTVPYFSGWQMVTMTLNASSIPTAFINTTQVFQSSGITPNAPTTFFYLGKNIGDEPVGGRAANCGIGDFMFYNKVLSSTELKQNFNALRGRYGI